MQISSENCLDGAVSTTSSSHSKEGLMMNSQSSLTAGGAAQNPPGPVAALLTPKEAAELLKVSRSWLAKARMRGDGPPFIRIGRSIRYRLEAFIQWMQSLGKQC
jgi:excisionase family DNA binding protein